MKFTERLKRNKYFLIAATLWAVVAVGFIFFGNEALASPALKMQVPPFDAEIYTLKNRDTGDPLTWQQCLEIEEDYKIRISKQDPELGLALLNGEFIVECVEVDADGQEIKEIEDE